MQCVLRILCCVLLYTFGMRAQVITEVHPTPASGEPEWIELFNSKDKRVVLRNYLVCDNKSCVRVDTLVLPALGYTVLTRDSVALRESRQIPVSVEIIEVRFPSLNNTTDRCELRNADSVVVDSMQYTTTVLRKGISLERIGTHAHNAISVTVDALPEYENRWQASVSNDSATCGYLNSQVEVPRDIRIGDVLPGNGVVTIQLCNVGKSMFATVPVTIQIGEISTEIFASTILSNECTHVTLPIEQFRDEFLNGYTNVHITAHIQDDRSVNNKRTVPLWFPPPLGDICITELMFNPMNGEDYIEIWQDRSENTSTTANTVTSFTGWIIRDATTVGVIRDTCSVNDAGYAVVQRTVPGIDLNATGDVVVLCTPSGFVVDSLEYTDKWHNSVIDDTKGLSLEKRSPQLPGTQGISWSTSTSLTGGTPWANNTHTLSVTTSNNLVANPSPFSSQKGSSRYPCVISWQQPFAQALSSLAIYTPSGVLIRELLNTVFTGWKGAVAWDGTDVTGNVVAPGPYVAVLESVEASGTKVYHTTTIVVVGE